jgi:drug/metabolite transporter (DMT)-like permease
MNWIWFAIGSAVALAAADILVKTGSSRLPHSWGLFLYGLGPFLLGLVWVLLRTDWQHFRPQQEPYVWVGLGVGVSFTCVTIGLYAAFKAGGPLSLVSPTVRIGGLVLASLVGLIVFREPLTWRYVIGLILACAGVYLIISR